MINVQTGELRQIIDIEQTLEVRSGSGAISNEPWHPYAMNIPAKITTSDGNEDFVGSEFITEATHVVFARYIPGLTTKMRINFRTPEQRAAGTPIGRLFRILKRTDVEERHVEHDIVAQEATRGWGL